MSESAETQSALARRRAGAARERVLSAAQKGVKWKIVRFFAQPTIAAWTALWYILLSLIGVIYSSAFYSRFDSVHIFDFFDTPDFLLSALQAMKMMVIGVVATLISISITVYRFYNSSIYSAYQFGGDKRRKEQESRIKQEAARLLFVSCLFTLLIFSYLWVISSYFLWDWSEPFISIGMVSSYLVSAIAPVLFVYCFYRLLRNVSRGDRITLRSRLFAFFLLAEAILILPFLAGVSDSKAALKDEERRVRVTLRQDGASPNIPSPNRTLLLGTTSSFHFFYECEKALTTENGAEAQTRWWNALKAEYGPFVKIQDLGQSALKPLVDVRWNTIGEAKCENGRPFIIPTANIASLEFIQAGEVPDDIVATITKLDIIIGNLKSEKIEITDAITQINAIITSINMSSETRTELMIPKIASPKQEIVTRLSPDEIATVAIALKSYLEGNIPVTHLNETIKNLEDLPDSDLAQIVEAIENLSIPGGQSLCTSSWEKVKTIGPFREGEHGQLEEGAKETAKEGLDQLVPLNQLVTKMNGHFTDQQTLQQLILIGRVDSVRLREEKRQFYGAQIELARARAEWVQKKLLKEFPTQIDPRRISLLSDNYREKNDNGHAPDRSVEVWACWTPKPTSPSADSPVRKGQTGD